MITDGDAQNVTTDPDGVVTGLEPVDLAVVTPSSSDTTTTTTSSGSSTGLFGHTTDAQSQGSGGTSPTSSVTIDSTTATETSPLQSQTGNTSHPSALSPTTGAQATGSKPITKAGSVSAAASRYQSHKGSVLRSAVACQHYCPGDCLPFCLAGQPSSTSQACGGLERILTSGHSLAKLTMHF